MNYIVHFAIAGTGALIGAYARNFCQHLQHKLIVGGGLLLLETILTVEVVG